jgi:hypothetical protein
VPQGECSWLALDKAARQALTQHAGDDEGLRMRAGVGWHTATPSRRGKDDVAPERNIHAAQQQQACGGKQRRQRCNPTPHGFYSVPRETLLQNAVSMIHNEVPLERFIFTSKKRHRSNKSSLHIRSID